MVRKCSVYGCKTNYASQRGDEPSKPTTIYGFPANLEERSKWLASLPNKIALADVTRNMGVCVKHFPSDVPMIKRGRYMVPDSPPSIFFNVPISCIPAQQPQPRSTTKSTSTSRARDFDEMPLFRELDAFCPVVDFPGTFTTKHPQYGVASFQHGEENRFVILSKERKGPIHDVTVYCSAQLDSEKGVIASLNIEFYRGLKRVTHPLFPKNVVRCWSQLDEVIRWVEERHAADSKHSFLLRQVELQNSARNSRLYEVDDLCLGLSWCTRSRSLYSELRKHIQLPSLTTLGRVTRTAKNVDDENLHTSVFDQLEERSKGCIIIIDEIYVKASISFRGGVLFGYAVDDPTKKATTLLAIMVKCMFGGPKFLAKLIPCAGLKADFQFQCVQEVLLSLERSGAKVFAVINDNNRMNQAFFRLFRPMSPQTPWMVQSATDDDRPMFLLFDPVHLIKNVRNNWITEATKTLRFPTPNHHLLAMWTHLEELHQYESQSMVKLSKLTRSSVAPSNIEKQNVSLALNVFCEETSSALKSSANSTEAWKDTATVIDAVVKLWKLLNCKSPFQDDRRRDPDRIPVELSSERGQRAFQTLTSWSVLANMMSATAMPRIQCLTKDTGSALAWTCQSLIQLCRFLLSTDTPVKHNYVTLGFYQQDDLEQKFGYFRMSAGCNYFITFQEVMSAHARDQAMLLLKTAEDHLDIYSNEVHRCDLCLLCLSDSELLLLDDMGEGCADSTADERQAVFFIAGYVAFKHQEHAGTPNQTPADVQAFLAQMDRGGLTYPSEGLYNVTLLAYCFIKSTPERFCRNRLMRIIQQFPDIFHLDISIIQNVARRIANILMKRFSLHQGQTDIDKTRKIAKLSSESH